MNLLYKLTLASALFITATTAAFAQLGPGEPIDGPEQQCYAFAMVGYDSVINSRLGVLPEHALQLAVTHKVTGSSYQPYLLKVVLDAYLWQQSPHNYAVKVMYNCAMSDVRIQTAQVDMYQ